MESGHVPSTSRQHHRGSAHHYHKRETRIPIDAVVSDTPGLREAPMGDRVCAAFSSERDGRMSFDDYLDMFSVMSDRASPEIKAHFAFAAFDFDGDGVVGKNDLGKVVDRLYHTSEKHLTAEEKRKVVSRLLDEIDVDKDGFVCKPEFRFAVARCADFFYSFKLYLE